MDALSAGRARWLGEESRLDRRPPGRVELLGLRRLVVLLPDRGRDSQALALELTQALTLSLTLTLTLTLTRHWRSSRTPDWPPLRTTSTLLLRALRIARLEPTLREMMRSRRA